MCKISLCLPYNDNKNDAPSEHVFASLFYLFWYCFPDVLDLLAFCAFHEWGYVQNLLVFYLNLSQLFYFLNVREGCGKPHVKREGTRISLCSHKLKLHDFCFNASPWKSSCQIEPWVACDKLLDSTPDLLCACMW